MDAAPPPSSVPVHTPPPQPGVLHAWPPSAQWATAFLLGATVTLLLVHSLSYLRWTTRPTELQSRPPLGYQIDVNEAERAALVQLPGIGDTLAGRIEEQRRRHGPFRSVEDLRQVPGIGPATLERLRPWVRVTRPAADSEQSTSRTAAAQAPAVRVNMYGPDGSRKPLSKKEENLKELIDVNRATVSELQRLPGIGPKLSQRILDERAKKPFGSVDDLRRVPGIGPKILERLRPYVTVGSERQRVAQAG